MQDIPATHQKSDSIEAAAPPSLPAMVSSWRGVLRLLDHVLPQKSEVSISRRRQPRFGGYMISFLFLVVLPSLVSILYLAFIAADQYVAEARFAVRTLQVDGGSNGADKLAATLSSLSLSSSASAAGQDSYVVSGYINSRAIIEDLSKTIDLKGIFRRHEADFWARLKSDASVEDLVSYWNGMVGTYVDRTSDIVSVTTRAFRREDALALSQAILSASEKLVNDVSARARADAMRMAEDEVRRTEGRVRKALIDLRAFRDSEGFLDPGSAATATSKLLMNVMAEKIKQQNELFVASRAMSSTAPTVKVIQSRIEVLDQQIEKLKSQLTGAASTEKPISESLAKFEELELQRVFSERLYQMARDALERARLRAERQNLYVSVFVPPSLPEEAKYPETLALSFIIPLVLLVGWGILALIAAAIEDHRL